MTSTASASPVEIPSAGPRRVDDDGPGTRASAPAGEAGIVAPLGDARAALVVLSCVAAFGVLARVAGPAAHGLPVDRSTMRFLVAHRSGVGEAVAGLVSHLGDPAVLVVLAVAAGAALRRWAGWVGRMGPALPLVALLAAAATETVLKRVIDRPRPPVALHLLHETDPSFPSGHTTGTAALVTVLLLLVLPALTGRGRAVVVLTGEATIGAVGLSRMVLGVHWASDVVAGWLLGSAWAIAVVVTASLIEERRHPVLRLRPGGPARTSSVGGG